MKSLLLVLCVAMGLSGCRHQFVDNSEIARVYRYILVDAGFSLRLNADHSYAFDGYFPFSIPDSTEKSTPPMEVGTWTRNANEVVLTSSVGKTRRFEITRKDGKIVLIEHITPRVANAYY